MKFFQKEQKESTNCRKKAIHVTSFVLLGLIFLLAALLMKAYFDGEFRSVATLQAYIARFGLFAPAVLVSFQILQVIIPVLPGMVGCAAGAIIFGAMPSFWYNYLAISAGSILAFFLARWFGAPLLDDLFPAGKYQRWATWASKSKSYTAVLFMAMILPLFPDDYLCYLTGLSQMRARRFTWIILLGKPWCILAYCLGFSLIK